jgi:GntR family transcriptional regulator, arabinose operon transcriptional repressor
LAVGEKLPAENEIAKQFNVSRITAKKALEMLTLNGMVVRQRGKGSFVVRRFPLTHSETATPMSYTALSQEPAPTLIGLVLPEVSESFGLRLLSSIERAAHKHGIFVTISRSYGEQQSEESAIQRLIRLGVKGLIVFPVNGENYNPEILRLYLDGFPLVLVDKHLPGIPVSAVTTDNNAAAYQLTQHLLDMGHTHIAFFSPHISDTVTLEDRWEGFSMALQERGITHNPQWSITNFPSDNPGKMDSGYDKEHVDTMQAFLKDNPDVTAVFATEFQVAVHTFIAAKKLGINVPDDLSIVCFDGPATNFIGWDFTHIAQDEATIGTEAVRILAAEIFQKQRPETDLVVVPAQLVSGDSTARPRNVAQRVMQD